MSLFGESDGLLGLDWLCSVCIGCWLVVLFGASIFMSRREIVGVPFLSIVACDVLIVLQALHMKKGLRMTWTSVGVGYPVFRVVPRGRVTGGTS